MSNNIIQLNKNLIKHDLKVLVRSFVSHTLLSKVSFHCSHFIRLILIQIFIYDLIILVRNMLYNISPKRLPYLIFLSASISTNIK